MMHHLWREQVEGGGRNGFNTRSLCYPTTNPAMQAWQPPAGDQGTLVHGFVTDLSSQTPHRPIGHGAFDPTTKQMVSFQPMANQDFTVYTHRCACSRHPVL